MAIYKVGSTKLEPFKPGMKTDKLKINVTTDALNRIESIDVEFTGVKETFKTGSSIKGAWKKVENYFQKVSK